MPHATEEHWRISENAEYYSSIKHINRVYPDSHLPTHIATMAGKGPAVRWGNQTGRGRRERLWLSMWLEKISCSVLPVPSPVTKDTGKNGERPICYTKKDCWLNVFVIQRISLSSVTKFTCVSKIVSDYIHREDLCFWGDYKVYWQITK